MDTSSLGNTDKCLTDPKPGQYFQSLQKIKENKN